MLGPRAHKHIIMPRVPIMFPIIPPSAPLPNAVWVSFAILPYSTKVGGL